MDVFGGCAASALKKSIEDRNLKFEEKLKSHAKSIAENKEILAYVSAKIDATNVIMSDLSIRLEDLEKIVENLFVQIGGIEHYARSTVDRHDNSLSLNNSIIDELRENVERLMKLSETHTSITATTTASAKI